MSRESSVSDQGSTDALGTEQGLRAAHEMGAKSDLGGGASILDPSLWAERWFRAREHEGLKEGTS